MSAHLQQTHTQPYITDSVQLSSVASLQHFSSVSSNPPSQTAPTISYRTPPSPPISPHNPSACTERKIGAELLFRGSLCNQAISCRRPGAVEKGGWTCPKKQQEAASHLSPLLRVYRETAGKRGGCEEKQCTWMFGGILCTSGSGGIAGGAPLEVRQIC